MLFRLILGSFFGMLALSVMPQSARTYASRSVLSEGNWYKLGVSREGVYKISATWMSSVGIPISGISSNSIRLYGNGGGMLPESNRLPRPDDLLENAIEVVDGGDGIFNGNDYLLFYARGPHHWEVNTSGNWQHKQNIYSDTAYYYLSFGGTGKRIGTSSNTAPPTVTIREMDERIFSETDDENLLNSGKDWWGNVMGVQPGQALQRNISFQLPGLILSEQVKLNGRLAARSIGNAAQISIFQGNQLLQDITLTAVSGQFLDQYAVTTRTAFPFLPTSSALNLQFRLTGNSSVTGWIDWLEIFARRQLSFNGTSFFSFRDARSVGNTAIAAYEIQETPAAGGAFVWEVSNPLEPVRMNTQQTGTVLRFVQDARVLREYVAGVAAGLPEPVYFGSVPKQNLHNSSPAQLLIVTSAALLTEAKRLAEHHSKQDGLSFVVVTTDQIYHEFGGQPDPVAVRDWVKMYYDKYRNHPTQKPEYLLLLGGGTYDYRGRKGKGNNRVPVWESNESLHPLFSYTSDDFFGLLDDEDDMNLNRSDHLLDIAIGRLPAYRQEEAVVMVNKIIRYRQPSSQGSWRMNALFMADDRDNNLHLNDAEQMTAVSTRANELININKLYLDAFPVVSGSGGDRYPQVNDALVNQCFQGTLLVNYTGHGSSFRLAEEAVFTAEEARRFNNPNRLPLFITASCDFAPHDNPGIFSLGDRVLKQDSTGGIALMTTTRAVFAYSNLQMNDQYVRVLLSRDGGGRFPVLGRSVLLAKNNTLLSSGDVLNNRKFTLLGDPALGLAIPTQRIRLTRLRGNTGTDTLRALGIYSCEGEVTNQAGVRIPNWSGTLEIAIYDQSFLQPTLANRPGSFSTPFRQQNTLLFRGTATVQNGEFTVRFMLPKDIRAGVGKARITMYASNGNSDAAGADTSRWIGGNSPVTSSDTEGPNIRLFLNDTNFRESGMTHENPLLIGLLADSSGINTSGNGIGHDITAVIDDNEREMLVLNNFYTAEQDRFTAGYIRFQLPELKEGEHKIRLKAWDLVNNSSEKTLRFWVRRQEKFSIGRVMNFPNPFTVGTTFSIEHNQPGKPLQLELDIYDVMGRPVRQIRTSLATAGTRNIQVVWDGSGISGTKLPKGIYIYHLKLNSGTQVAQASGRILRN